MEDKRRFFVHYIHSFRVTKSRPSLERVLYLFRVFNCLEQILFLSAIYTVRLPPSQMSNVYHLLSQNSFFLLLFHSSQIQQNYNTSDNI